MLKVERGCEEPSQIAVWADGDDETYFSCPRLWLTQDSTDWYREYLYDTEFGTSTSYSDQSNKYIDAWMVYKGAFGRYQLEQTEKRMKPKKQDDLDSMARNLMAQKRGGK
jgi:hypothetical protein